MARWAKVLALAVLVSLVPVYVGYGKAFCEATQTPTVESAAEQLFTMPPLGDELSDSEFVGVVGELSPLVVFILKTLLKLLLAGLVSGGVYYVLTGDLWGAALVGGATMLGSVVLMW